MQVAMILQSEFIFSIAKRGESRHVEAFHLDFLAHTSFQWEEIKNRMN